MAKNEKKANKENKRFFKDFKAEIKKVIWPTPKQLVNNTVAIITMVIVIGVIVFVLDLAFDAVNKYGLTNLQKTVQSSDVSSDSSDNDSENTEATEATESTEAIDVTESDEKVVTDTEETTTDNTENQ